MTGLSWTDIFALLGVVVIIIGIMFTREWRLNMRIDQLRREQSDKLSAVYHKIDGVQSKGVQHSHMEDRLRSVAEQYKHVLDALTATNGRLDNLMSLMVQRHDKNKGSTS